MDCWNLPRHHHHQDPPNLAFEQPQKRKLSGGYRVCLYLLVVENSSRAPRPATFEDFLKLSSNPGRWLRPGMVERSGIERKMKTLAHLENGEDAHDRGGSSHVRVARRNGLAPQVTSDSRDTVCDGVLDRRTSRKSISVVKDDFAITRSSLATTKLLLMVYKTQPRRVPLMAHARSICRIRQ
jgi:hypothetical protein